MECDKALGGGEVSGRKPAEEGSREGRCCDRRESHAHSGASGRDNRKKRGRRCSWRRGWGMLGESGRKRDKGRT